MRFGGSLADWLYDLANGAIGAPTNEPLFVHAADLPQKPPQSHDAVEPPSGPVPTSGDLAHDAITFAARARVAARLRRQAQMRRKPSFKRTKSDPSRGLKPLGYEVLGPIAAGAFSTILRCRMVNNGETVAIKSFDAAVCDSNPALGSSRDNELAVLRLLRATAADSAGHPNVANMLEELGDAGSSHQHAVLEYADGGSLARYLQLVQKKVPSGSLSSQSAVQGVPERTVAAATRQVTPP